LDVSPSIFEILTFKANKKA